MKESRKMLVQSARFAAVGLEMGICVFLGIIGGKYLDELTGYAPVFFWIGLVLGLSAAAKAIVDAARLAKKVMEANEDE